MDGNGNNNNEKKISILMYPWFAMGHFITYISTANRLAEKGNTIFVIIPPKTRPKLDPLNLYPDHIKFIPVSIPKLEGLRDTVETTNDGLSFQESQLLRHALDLTKPVIRSLLVELRPDFVFSDFMPWLPGLARDLGIKSVHYCSVGATAAGSLFEGSPESIQMSKHTAAGLEFFRTMKEMGSGITMSERLITSFSDCDAMAFNTCNEVEGDFCRFLENKLNKPILLIGPPILKEYYLPTSKDDEWGVWLDKFEPKSVIYCCFGSEIDLIRDQFEQLLLGIEQTGLPFLIALRPPLGVETIEEALPGGFKERIGKRGVVHGGWIPQIRILKHPSVGCFVTHCGFGSTWEGLMSECQLVPLAGPIGEQPVNAKLLSGILKVGVEVEKGDEDGLFTKEGVHGAIMAAMDKESKLGKEIRENHDKLRELILKDGFHDSYFDTFVHNLRNLLP